jgi:hypothetical protein
MLALHLNDVVETHLEGTFSVYFKCLERFLFIIFFYEIKATFSDLGFDGGELLTLTVREYGKLLGASRFSNKLS